MPEINLNRSPEAIREESIENEIKQETLDKKKKIGILYKREIDPNDGKEKSYVYIANPYESHPTLVKVEIGATEEEVEAIKKAIIPMQETHDILVTLATTYKLGQPVLIEGPTAVGKTYVTEKFNELLWGKGVKPLDFYCSGQTDVSELMARWVPKVETAEDRKKWVEFLELADTKAQLGNISQEVAQKEELPQEQRLALIHTRIQELAKSAGLSDKTQWKLQYGAIPRAMGLIRNSDGTYSHSDTEGTGFTLHIEEVGLAEPQVINALLKLRGKRGKTADSIQLWENGGRTVKAGPRFWMVMTTNPPEEYISRNEIDPALARGVVFKRVGELSEESLKLAAEHYFTYKTGERAEGKPDGCILDLREHPEIGREISEIVAVFHNEFNKRLKAGGEKGRQQRIPLSLDDFSRVSDYILGVQIRSKESGYVDLTETLRRAVQLYYLDRLADKDFKDGMKRHFEEILTGVTGQKVFEGTAMKRSEILKTLVERASVSTQDIGQEVDHLEDVIGQAASDGGLPEHIRERLRKMAQKQQQSS